MCNNFIVVSRKNVRSIMSLFYNCFFKGSPELKEYKDCTYIFEWKTSLTCGAVMGNWTSPCIIKDQLLSHECNLSLLYKDKKIYHVSH